MTTPNERQLTLPQTLAQAHLPEGRVLRAIHLRGAAKTVAHIRVSERPPRGLLYWRKSGDSQYEVLLDPGPNRSVDDVVYTDGSLVFARRVEWLPFGAGLGSKTLGITRIDLADEPTNRDEPLSDMLPADASVVSLLRANDGGTSLQAVVLFKVAGAATERRARYVICTLDLLARRTTELDELPGIHH